MYFLSIAAMLLLEHFQPRPVRLRLAAPFLRYITAVTRRLKLADTRGVFSWSITVIPPVAAMAAVSYALYRISPLLAWLLNVAVLYFSVECTTFSRHAGVMAEALAANRLDEAHGRLEKWSGRHLESCSEGEMTRLAVEQTLIGAYRDLFGGLAWFIVFGPAGALAYRLAAIAGRAEDARGGDHFAGRVLGWMDWAPVRAVALSFAVAGNFQDALECWRSQASSWHGEAEGILLASAAGALGVKLGGAVSSDEEDRPELGAGEEADAGHIQSAIGINWRILALWLALLLLFAWV
ncbi:MAG TPA: CobD/CbiB family protein [Betaproteobacteria bacterium]|nr:CobD/CbiB family protein [Betaproteobacteria bacterium]